MQFLSGIFFYGILGVIIPVVIHLWSKNTRYTIPFGSLKFISETSTRSMKSIIPSDWLLLLLRILIITTLVIILADLVILDTNKAKRTFLIDPAYKNSKWFENLKDTLDSNDKIKWLGNKFPDLEDSSRQRPVKNYWFTLNKIYDIQSEEIIVVSPLLQTAFNGKRSPVPYINLWLNPEVPSSSASFILSKNDQSYNLSMHSDELFTDFDIQKSQLSGTPVEVTYSLVKTDSYNEAAIVFESAIAAINETGLFTIFEIENIEKADWLFWLSDKPIPARRNIVQPGDNQSPFLSKTSPGLFSFNPILMQSENVLHHSFPLKLEQILSPELKVFSGLDYRRIAQNQIIESEQHAEITNINFKSFNDYLWILLIVLLTIERILSNKR